MPPGVLFCWKAVRKPDDLGRLSGRLTTFPHPIRRGPPTEPGRAVRNDRFQLLSPWPDEAMQFAGAVERAGRLILAARRGLSAALSLTVPTWRLLKAVSQSRGDLSVAGAARRLRLARQTMRAIALDLRRKGWLELNRCPVDRRIWRLALTPEGTRILAQLETVMRVLLLEMTNDISLESLEVTTELLNRMFRRPERAPIGR